MRPDLPLIYYFPARLSTPSRNFFCPAKNPAFIGVFADSPPRQYHPLKNISHNFFAARNPDKLEAKRAKDRARIAAKRAAAKQANEPANVA